MDSSNNSTAAIYIQFLELHGYKPTQDRWVYHIIDGKNHLGNGLTWSSDIELDIKSDIKNVAESGGFVFYKTQNSIYYQKGTIQAVIGCNCTRRPRPYLV